MALSAFDVATVASAPWTADAVRDAFPENIFHRYQLVDGVLVMTPSPGEPHQNIVRTFWRTLDRYLFPLNRANCLYASPADLSWEEGIIVQPDLFVVAPNEARHAWQYMKTLLLAVEIVSPSSKEIDYKIKRDIYMRNGVREYWIVDPDKRQVTVWRRGQATPEQITQTLTWRPDPLLASPVAVTPEPLVLDVTALW